MKILLVFMSADMYSHDMSLQKTFVARNAFDEGQMGGYINQYKEHFDTKHVAKLVLTVVQLDEETGAITPFNSEVMVHPKKEKIIINKQKPVTGRNSRLSQPNPIPADIFLSGYNWNPVQSTFSVGTSDLVEAPAE